MQTSGAISLSLHINGTYRAHWADSLGFYFPATNLPTRPKNKHENERIEELEELEFLNRPSPTLVNNRSVTEVEDEPRKLDEDEVLEPFYKFFRPTDSMEQANDSEDIKEDNSSEDESKKVSVEYYEPKLGDFVVGVVVSGSENKLDVNVGADLLGTMLTKEVLPLYDKELDYLLCDTEKGVEELMVRGKMRILRNEDALSGEPMPKRPVVKSGTVFSAEVLGRTLSGRPLLSTRRSFKRITWHRVRQIKQLNEPIEVRITEWNTGGLLTRVEDLRAFIPKAELINRIKNFTELKENVRWFSAILTD
ncbi:unnamed protein product [Ilex paraguariensis]|uniref:S1 motif domain-containing protein n=1 Tax=Ilex paraguariensis TaxID=185542 RepID=A0ABC8UI35_9AQUA